MNMGFSNQIWNIEDITSQVLQKQPTEKCYLKTLCKEFGIDYLEVKNAIQTRN